jgi:hypothetical protein
MADCHAALKDYISLLKLVENQKWGNLEYWRFAISAKAFKEIGNPSQFQANWQKSLEQAQNQLNPLSHLYRFTSQEKWTNENQEILWTIASHHPNEKWVFQSLEELLYSKRDTRQLLKLYSQIVEVDPNDYRAKNNLAFISLLLDPSSNLAYSLARETYNHSPTNAYFLSTLAFALHLKNQTADAIKLCENLNAKALENPAIAICYGVILGSTGDAKAKPFLNKVDKQHMLPELVALAEKTQSAIK